MGNLVSCRDKILRIVLERQMPKIQVTVSEIEACFIDAVCSATGLNKSEFVAGILRQGLREMMRCGDLEKWERFKAANLPDEETPED